MIAQSHPGAPEGERTDPPEELQRVLRSGEGEVAAASAAVEEHASEVCGA